MIWQQNTERIFIETAHQAITVYRNRNSSTIRFIVTAKGQPPEFLLHIAMTAKNINFSNF